MAQLITEPTSFIQGDTVSWKITDADHPAPAWTLAYHLVSPTARKSVTAAHQADGSHLVTIDAAASAAYAAVTWTWQRQFTSDTERVTDATGAIEVVADFALVGATTGLDTRTHAEIALAALEAVFEKRATHDELEYQITTAAGSRAAKLLSHEQLIAAIKVYRGLVDQQKADANAKKYGRPKILARIGRT